MDWDLKIPAAWDIVSELDLASASGAQSPPSPSPLELKLNTGMPGPLNRRPKSGATGGGQARCLVEGCRAELSKCREYHRRHKVCELHSKTPVVIVSGREQRFCQQCSRYCIHFALSQGLLCNSLFTRTSRRFTILLLPALLWPLDMDIRICQRFLLCYCSACAPARGCFCTFLGFVSYIM